MQLVLAGLYPPKQTAFEWNEDLNWQPIPHVTIPAIDDALILPIQVKPCPRYIRELQRVLQNELKYEIDGNAEMLHQLSVLTGTNITTPKLVHHLYGTLKAEVNKW